MISVKHSRPLQAVWEVFEIVSPRLPGKFTGEMFCRGSLEGLIALEVIPEEQPASKRHPTAHVGIIGFREVSGISD